VEDCGVWMDEPQLTSALTRNGIASHDEHSQGGRGRQLNITPGRIDSTAQ
jgi:hypothetical protein